METNWPRNELAEARRQQVIDLLHEPGWKVAREILRAKIAQAQAAALASGMTIEKLAELRGEVKVLRELTQDPSEYLREQE